MAAQNDIQMRTSRTTLDDVKDGIRKSYTDGREMGFSDSEAVERALAENNAARGNAVDWTRNLCRRFDREGA